MEQGEGDPSDVCSLIAQKEQEIAKLREGSLKQLEEKLRHKEEQLRSLQQQLASLQADFQYNLELLDGRDAELAAFEAALHQAAKQGEQKDALVAAMQQAVSEAEAALLAEHAGRERAEASLQQQRRALMQELADAKSAAARELQLAQDSALARCSGLEAKLQAAQQECVKAEQGHQRALAHLQEDHNKHATKLHLRVTVLEQLGQQREADLKVVQQDLRERTSHAAAVTARLESLQQEAKALAAKAESMQRTHKAEVSRQQQDKEALTQQLQQQERAHQALVKDLQRKLDAVQQRAVEHQTERTSECSRLEAAQRAEVQALEGKLAKASEQSVRLTADLEEARAALELQHSVLQEQLQRLLADKDVQLQALQEALEAQKQHYEDEIKHLRHEASSDKQGLRDMSQQLAAVEAYAAQQEQELAKHRESMSLRELQKVAAGLGPSMEEWEGMLKKVTLQRDEAQNTAKECQARLALREMEVQQLQQQITARQLCSPNRCQHGGDSSSSLDDVFVGAHTLSGMPVGPSGNSLSAQAIEGLAHRRALEAAQAQNAQLQAALHALTAEMQQFQQAQLEAHPVRLQALQDATNVQPDAGQAQVRRLRKEVSRLKCEVHRLEAENGRLMEMSNELRAERNKFTLALMPTGSCGSPAYSLMPRPLLLPCQSPSITSGTRPCLGAFSGQSEPPPQLQQPSMEQEPIECSALAAGPAWPDGQQSSAFPATLVPFNCAAALTPDNLGVVGQQVARSAVVIKQPAKPGRLAADMAPQKGGVTETTQPSPPKHKVRNYNIKD